MQDLYTTLAFLAILLAPCISAYRAMRKDS